MVSRVLESHMLQTLIPRLPTPLCNAVTKSNLWSVAAETSWVLYNVLFESREDDDGRAVAARMLLDLPSEDADVVTVSHCTNRFSVNTTYNPDESCRTHHFACFCTETGGG